MTLTRWMPIGVLALLLGAVVPANAQNVLTQVGSALALGQEDEPKCPCCVDVECCANPVTFLNQIVVKWFGLDGESRETTASPETSERCTQISGCPAACLPACPVQFETLRACNASMDDVAATAVRTATNGGTLGPCTPCIWKKPTASTSRATNGGTLHCCTPATGLACSAAKACCGDNCQCCGDCKCKKTSKCQCCKNCECSTCGASAVFRCPFLSQFHGGGHPMVGRRVQVIHHGGRHPFFMPPVVCDPMGAGQPWPVITEVHPPIPLPTVVQNQPQIVMPHVAPGSRYPHAPAGTTVPPIPSQLVSNALPPRPATHQAIRIQATAGGVQIEAPGLKARCDRIAYHGPDDVVELEGNVKVEYHRNNRSAKIVADHVVIRLGEDSLEVAPGRSTSNVVPTTYTVPVETYTPPVPEQFPHPTPAYTAPRRFGNDYNATPRDLPRPLPSAPQVDEGNTR